MAEVSDSAGRPTHTCLCCGDSIVEGYVWLSSDASSPLWKIRLEWAKDERTHPSETGYEPEATILQTGLRHDAYKRAHLCLGCGALTIEKPDQELPDMPPQNNTQVVARAEPTECLSCGQMIPADTDRCRACGWSYGTTHA